MANRQYISQNYFPQQTNPARLSLEEALEALDPRLGEEAGIQLEQVGLEEVAIDLRIQVRLVAHELGEPLEALLAIRGKDGVLRQAVPDLLRLRIGVVIMKCSQVNYRVKGCVMDPYILYTIPDPDPALLEIYKSG